MLRFVTARDVTNEGIDLSRPTKALDGEGLGFLTTLVIDRFLEGVDWDAVTSMYLTGLADADDIALITRAVKALMAGGVEYVGP